MYFYRVSEGEYTDYMEKIIYHEKEFSKDEFLGMINSVPDVKNKSYDNVSVYLCENYGFTEIEIYNSAHNNWFGSSGWKWK